MALLASAVVEPLRAVVVAQAGGYLRNTIREPHVTCAVCATPCPGYERCFTCNTQRRPGLANRVGAITYAAPGSQSGHLMRGYKAQPPVTEHVQLVSALLALALSLHSGCAERLAGTIISGWATVPSLPHKAGVHALRQLARGMTPGSEVVLTAASEVADARAVNSDHFAVPAEVTGRHILLLDDTWTGGGHAQSAALALHDAGATEVSVLVVARWYKTDYGDNAAFAKQRLKQDFDPAVCPWTGAECP